LIAENSPQRSTSKGGFGPPFFLPIDGSPAASVAYTAPTKNNDMSIMEPTPIASPGKNRSLLAIIGPGLLLAATGVGGGDLATASIVGGMLGVAVLWAVVVGAFLKFVVTEGLARWQLASGETLIEGAVRRCGRIVVWVFLPYLLLWSFFVASAQMSASGVTLHAMFPIFEDARHGKIVFGVLAGLLGLALVTRGGYRAFQLAMRACIGAMFVMTVVTAIILWPGTAAVMKGLFVPVIPRLDPEAVVWTVALIGGIGGTLTVLCYGYWLREEGRTGSGELRTCRLDLALSYVMTAVFGIAMVIVGTSIQVEGEGTQLLVRLSDRLGQELGEWGRILFLIGTFGTVFSSLLGVWQAVPYLFADCWQHLRDGRRHDVERSGPHHTVDTRSKPYRVYLVLLAILPMIGLFTSFREVQKLYTVIGALFFPVLAIALLIANGRWVQPAYRNRPATVIALLGVLVLFAWIGIAGIQTT
jgi:Mn2+/Fe2+ NRAMP family transporter